MGSALSSLYLAIPGVSHPLAACSFVLPDAHRLQLASLTRKCESCLGLVLSNSSCLRLMFTGACSRKLAVDCTAGLFSWLLSKASGMDSLVNFLGILFFIILFCSSNSWRKTDTWPSSPNGYTYVFFKVPMYPLGLLLIVGVFGHLFPFSCCHHILLVIKLSITIHHSFALIQF